MSWPTPFHDGGVLLCQINLSYTGGDDDHRWGDYTGTAPDLLNTNGTPSNFPGLWFSGMYVKANGHGGTCVGANAFSTTQNGD